METPQQPQTGTPAGPYITGMSTPTQDEKMWGTLAHLLMIALIGPVLIYFTKAKESSFVREHAVEALNFQITCLLFYIAMSVLSGVLGIISGGLLAVVLGCLSIPVILGALVLLIIASMKANQGLPYQYPFNLRFLK